MTHHCCIFRYNFMNRELVWQLTHDQTSSSWSSYQKTTFQSKKYFQSTRTCSWVHYSIWLKNTFTVLWKDESRKLLFFFFFCKRKKFQDMSFPTSALGEKICSESRPNFPQLYMSFYMYTPNCTISPKFQKCSPDKNLLGRSFPNSHFPTAKNLKLSNSCAKVGHKHLNNYLVHYPLNGTILDFYIKRGLPQLLGFPICLINLKTSHASWIYIWWTNIYIFKVLSKISKDYIKNCTNTRLVCTHSNVFFILNLKSSNENMNFEKFLKCENIALLSVAWRGDKICTLVT